ncbi:MFS general substrate transporter [Lindgomyces ingoldianus]|uniref:MFS general substrate transporter n=1 Tax=Lindgomyces ingoldianus TaxID=673940 RepID=A0ACB6R3J7_9PLEO|nr:MFS general substrate transporter [Lindgomyces ingoldianus]KAF2473884.1 MFS general substrate transporter [Lindgomyces ingoldianus]
MTPPSRTPPQERVDDNGKNQKASYWGLPKKGQLAVLCLARIADPLAITSIQSYMFYQLKFFNPLASNATISTQAGILVGTRTAAQVFTGMIWGRLADSDLGGRKVVLFIGLVSCGISYIGYGLARSFAMAIFWQVFAGLMSNNVAITRCVVAELNPEKRYRTRALLLLPLCASAAQLLGPLIGGLLSLNTRDASQSKVPYLAPNLLLALIYFLAALAVILFMEETLESLQGTQSHWLERISQRLKARFSKKSYSVQTADTSSNSNYTASETTPLVTASTPTKPKRKRKLPFRRIWTFNVVCTMVSHFIIAGHLGTFSNLWAIFLTAPTGPSNPSQRSPPFKFTGGLGMLPRDVGFALSLLGAISMILQMGLYPMLQDRFGTIKIWRTALFIFPFVYLLAPYPSLVASAPEISHKTAYIWVSMTAVLLLFTLGRTGVTPATTLLINDCTPHPSVRGTIHAAATVLGHLSRSIFPVMALAVFGQGLQIGVVGLGFWCLAVLAVASCVASAWVREGSNGDEIVLEESGDDEEEDVGEASGRNGSGRGDLRRG